MLIQIAIGAALFLGVGAIASRAEGNERVAKRLAAIVFTIIVASFAISVARGDFLRLAPGGADGEADEQGALP